MNRKSVEQEGLHWVEQEIITPDQYKQIVSLYSERKLAVGIIPILGSILLSLGIISYVAANWFDFPHIVRMFIIIVVMSGFYFSGEYFIHKGQNKLGIALISVGLVTFGAGTMLVTQMFHLQLYNLSSWIAWALCGVVLTYLYRNGYLYLLSLLICLAAQWYSAVHFRAFSWTDFAITIIGLGFYCWKRKSQLYAWFFCICFTIQSIMLIAVNDWKFIWVFIPEMILYLAGDLIHHRHFAVPWQIVPLISFFIFDFCIVLDIGDLDTYHHYERILANPWQFIPLIALLLLGSLAAKHRAGRLITGWEWCLMLPIVYIAMPSHIIYLLVMFLFSLFYLWRGYVEEWRFKINLATVLFLSSTMAAYIKLTWTYMDKSLFFIIGGMLLLGLSWFLNRRKKQFFTTSIDGERENHE